MLKLGSLEIIGFKSFARKTRIVFDGSVISIVGPNGCGKSNIFDAIGWVLGAQSARSLRGERMEDVIFSGSEKRGPSGVAQVKLTMRRDDETPVVVNGKEVSGEDLEICRKLYRSGESLYLINQRRCRLKDVHQVLEDIGLGYASYALIAQGKIDSFLTGKPGERRLLIEEAAGISGYKSRRRSAELKLEMAQQNLLRVNDIIEEIERRLRSLKRQAAKARRYRDIHQEFRRVQRHKVTLEATHLNRHLAGLQHQLQVFEDANRDLDETFLACRKTQERSLEARESLEADLSHLRRQQSEVRLEVDRSENSIRHYLDQIQTTQRHLQDNRDEQEAIRQSLLKANQERAHFQAQKEALEARQTKAENLHAEQTDQVRQATAEVGRIEAQVEELRNQLLRLSAETVSLGNLKEQLEDRIKETAVTRERLERDRVQDARKLRDSSEELESTRRLISDRGARLAAAREEIEKQLQERRELESTIKDLEAEATEIRNRLIAYRERFQSLSEVEMNHSQYSEGVRKLLNHLSAKPGIHSGGTLADHIETSPQYERLVEEFLEEELEYVVVDSMDEAVRGRSEVKALQSGRCTFLSLRGNNGDAAGGGRNGRRSATMEEGVHGRLGELLRMDPEVEGAFRRLFPQRASAIVVSHLERAIQLAHSHPDSTFVTLEAETLSAKGLLSASAAPSKKLGFLSLKRQKRQLERKIAAANKSLAASAEKEQLENRRLQKVLDACSLCQEAERELEKEIIGLKHQQQEQERDARRLRQALQVVADETMRLRQEESSLQERARQVEADLAAKSAARREAEERIHKAQESLRQFKRELGQRQERLHSIASDRKVLSERRLALGRTLERIDQELKDLRSRGETTRRAEKENEQRLDTLNQDLSRTRTSLRKFKKQQEQTDTSLERHEKEFQGWKETHSRIEGQLRQLQDEKTERQKERGRLDIELARLETQLQELERRCAEELQSPLQEVVAGVDDRGLDLNQTARLYEKLRQRLESFGPVNMTALDEYQENEERHNFLSTQRSDTEQSIADTARAIQDLDRRSREKFRQAFDTVNHHFNEVFRKLFGGGECGMRLLDEQNMLESGIDIHARPPGKREQNVMLLSGGEKALTVLALLVGLFTYRPSRFCVLDEVDAALDDANVARFADLMREMSQKTQLVLITHNHQTVETSDALFGVTMNDPGISQVVSVRISPAVQDLPANPALS
ncbi:MAG: chromosome segregation protein SMC [Acidobacteriota bacterium]